jgi:hypothetical protein
MRLPGRPRGRPRERGSALLLSFLVLIVLAAIIFQLYIGTSTDARVARNDVTLAAMDQAIESALLEVYDRLLSDGESAASGGGEAAAAPELGPELPEAGPGAEEEAPSVDSREDSWGRPQRTAINDVELRVLVQDEDSKLNVLGILAEDQEQADEHFERLVRVIDLAREDTREDIDRSEARRLAEDLRAHLTERMSSVLPKPVLLSDDPDDEDRGLPLTLRECVALEQFHDGLFRDFRDESGTIVHSLGTFLTVWSSLATHSEYQTALAEGETGAAPEPPPAEPPPDEPGGEPPPAEGPQGEAAAGTEAEAAQGGAPGVAVNLNTAPAAVLKALIDDRDVPWRFWDEVIEFRNLEEEQGEDDDEPVLDEYGEELVRRQVFDSLEELELLDEWDALGPEERDRVLALVTTESNVFSIYVTARRATSQGDEFGGYRGAPPPGEQEDLQGGALVRTVASVVWRREVEGELQIVPLVRWDVLDYTPFEVQDYPEDWR